MKKIFSLIAMLLFIASPLLFSQQYDYKTGWTSVQHFEKQGLPKSALSLVDEMYGKAVQEKNYPEFLKTFIYKMKFKSGIQEEALFKVINETERVADSASFPVKPVLHSMLAEMYWWYFQNNRYKFYNRSYTAQVVSNDISTWDLKHLVIKVMNHYKASLERSDSLKQVKLELFRDILFIHNKDEINIRPTLYDFLALRAVEFYSSEESHLPLPVDEFSINEAYLQPAASFAGLSIRTTDTLSFNFQVVKFYQELVKFHLNDANPATLVDVDLKRIKFIDGVLASEERDSLYLNALYDLEKRLEGYPMQAEIGLEIAERFFELGELYNPEVSQQYRWEKEIAINKCVEIGKKFPAKTLECDRLVKKIHAKSIRLELEKEMLPNLASRALLLYRNSDSVYIRIIRTSHEKLERYGERYNKENYKKATEWDRFIIPVLVGEKPFMEFAVALPKDKDYQVHGTEIKIPALSPGVYIIMAGTGKSFDYTENMVTFGTANVTNISFINRRAEGDNSFYLLHRKTGEPLAGAEVEVWANSYSYSDRKYSPSLQTSLTADAEGFFKVTKHSCVDKNFWLNISYNGEQWNTKDISWFQTGTYFYNHKNYDDKEKDKIRTYIFTDRAIYRPGQTIYFKGIVVYTNKQKKSEVVPKTSATVQLMNVNRQQVGAVVLTTNEYGAFSGTFTAPTSGLNGLMTIQSLNGSKGIRVEDYKRPKFEVKFDTLRNSYKLNEKVQVKAFAKAYSGADIDNATVKYRVVRRTNFYYGYWWFMPPSVPEKEITNGTIKTSENGEFEISFKAIPGNVNSQEGTSFTYTVFADVTDQNGETHSGTFNVNIGYQALVANIQIPEKIEKNRSGSTFKITTHNLNGDFVSASGEIVVVRLHGPDKVMSDRKWFTPDKFTMSSEDFYKAFPFSPYAGELDPSTWKTADTVYKSSFNTGKGKFLELTDIPKWKSGMYKAALVTKDQYNTPVASTSFFTVFDSRGTDLPYHTSDWYHLEKNTLEPGDTARVSFGSSFDKARVLVEVEHKNKIVKKEWLKLKKGQNIFSLPITEDYRGNVGVHFTYVSNNNLYTHNSTITVPYTNKMLDVSFETFRNKLQPGEKEQWKIRIKDKYGDKVAAEMVASLYDASLDALSPHAFNFDILERYTPYLNWSSSNGFGTSGTRSYTSAAYFTFNTEQNLYWLNWFGFDARVLNGRQRIFRPKDPGDLRYQPGSKVSGTVCDETGEPLPGANIVVVGTTRGTITDINGNFSIMVPPFGQLQVLFIGFKPVYIQAKKGHNLKITLEPDFLALEEVVVVGYGTSGNGDYEAPQPNMDRKEEDKSVPAIHAEAAIQLAHKKIDLSNVNARTNLNETAFFFPHLQTDHNGDVLVSFTIPEALTRWKMLGFAHTSDLKHGFVENELVTQKELMVVPNAPRFFRENDTIAFTAKVNGLTENRLHGSAQLMLFDALTMKPVDTMMHNTASQQNFSVQRGESANLSWRIVIPTGLQAVTYRVVARAGDFSDGEESAIPVLTNSMLVTETLPLPVKGRTTKTFTLDKLVHNSSTTLRNHKLTLEFTSNPAWYAIQALPYLMEYPYECAEQTFSRFYANSIAAHVANSSPKIKQVFESWKNLTPDALRSNLEKNQELKGLLLEETPWVLQARNETERKQRVALLFDINRLANELDRTLNKLKKMQVSNGGWPWFEGMPDSWYITQHIVCGLGKLDHLGIRNVRSNFSVWNMTTQAIAYLDERIAEDYKELQRLAKAGRISLTDNHLGYLEIHYLYARSFFTDIPLYGNRKEAFDYFMNQAQKYWLKNDKYMQGMISLALNRFKDKVTAVDIIKSLREHALYSEEMGMYWKNGNGWYWYQAPIETQALMIEAFDEVVRDSAAVNEMKVWLLKQKQTQDWKTTRATVEACYALLLRGTDWLANDNPVEITVGDVKVDPKLMPEVKVEAGTGYFKTSWSEEAIKPEMGKITIQKNDNGVSWGAVYWQYFEQLDKITTAETPLKLKKQLFLQRNTNAGPVIYPVTDTTRLNPGDLIKVRIELRVDRTMEYVHMKDMRASAFEPVNVLSRYKYQDGLGYYESTRDAATNFFFERLPKGTHVFEYPLRVTHYGNFSNGITTIQCMYAPEFTSHSEGVRVMVGGR